MIFSVWMQAVRESHSRSYFLMIITIYKLTQLKPALPNEADMSHLCIYSYRYHVHTWRYYIILALNYNINIVTLFQSWNFVVPYLFCFCCCFCLPPSFCSWDVCYRGTTHFTGSAGTIPHTMNCWTQALLYFFVCYSLHNMYGFILVL